MDALSAVATSPVPALREKTSAPDVSRDKRKKSKEEKQEVDDKGVRESRRAPFVSQGASLPFFST